MSAIAIIPGKATTITIAGVASPIFNFSFSSGSSLLPVAAYGTTNAFAIQGLAGVGGSFSFYLSKNIVGCNPFNSNGGATTITYDTGCTVTLNTVLSAPTIVGSVDGLNVVSVSFASADGAAPTIAWDEA